MRSANQAPERRGPAKELVGGISLVRDGRDILPYICGHYLRLGFDRLLFIDDGSSDGTFEFLQKLSRREKRVLVRRVDLPDFQQSKLMTGAANELIRQGFHIIFPFDQDEFWNIELCAIRRVARQAPGGLFRGEWTQFVQDRRVKEPGHFGLLRAKYRAPALARGWTTTPVGKPRQTLALPKMGFKSSDPVAVGGGQHALKQGPTVTLAEGLEVFHLSVRSERTLEWRKSTAPRMRNVAVRLKKLLDSLPPADRRSLAERDEGPWELNSADRDGCMAGEDGLILALVPDRRLQALLLRAWIYMLLHHPVLLLR
jgi:hypothetical protein